MRRYIIVRVFLFLPTLLGVATLVFLLNRAMPGDPVDVMLGENAPMAKRAELRHALHLDLPLYAQYARYLEGLASGNLGRSLRSGRTVASEIGRAFPLTFELASAAMLLACLIAFPVGLAASWLSKGGAGRMLEAASSAGMSLPSFFLGPILLYFFAVEWPLFPVSGADEPGSLFLPAVTLAVPMAALLSRIVKASLEEEAGRDYLRTARMKGLKKIEVLRRHALRNAMLPVATVAGLQFGVLLTGAIITEKIFRWPGLGTLVLNSISSRDYPLVQGVVLVFAVVTLSVNLFTDLLYTMLDPRVRYGG